MVLGLFTSPGGEQRQQHRMVIHGYLQNVRFLTSVSLQNTAVGGDRQTLSISFIEESIHLEASHMIVRLTFVFVLFVPLSVMACLSKDIELNLGHDYIALLSGPKSQSVFDDEFDFIKTFPESAQKTKLKKMFIDTSRDNWYISRISYRPNENKLLFVGFEIRESCAGVSAYMRRLDGSKLFKRISWSRHTPIKIGDANRHEFEIELYLQ